MADNQTPKERLKEITDGIEQGITELFQSEKYKQYLSTMSRFHTYSVNNQMLIFMQKPSATHVAGFGRWRDQFERHVMKGEKGIKIIAPTPYKKKMEMEKIDPITQRPILDEHGNTIMEEKEIKVPMFKVVSVFDVAQTDGKPLPQLVSDLTGDVQRFEVFMEALRRSSPAPIEMEPMKDGADGYFDMDANRIALREGMSEVQTVAAGIHEVSHAKLHNKEAAALQPVPKNRRTEEVEAESIGYAVCQYYDIQTDENSFPYIASWSKDKELPELRASLETINKTAAGLIGDIDRHYKEICQERGIDLTRQEAVYLVDDVQYLHVQSTDEGYDYTFYDKNTLQVKDGGTLDDPDLSLYEAFGYLLDLQQLENSKDVPLDILDDIHKQQEMDFANSPFLNAPQDAYAIYQLKEQEDLREHRYEPMKRIEAKGLSVQYDNYRLAYTAPLETEGSTMQRLESLFMQYNDYDAMPYDFKGHSLSTSDIIALKQDGAVSCHYVDSFDYVELPGFLSAKNPLRSVEDAMEQNDNQLDGIINNTPTPSVAELEARVKAGQSISLMDLARATHQEEKASIREQLKQQPSQQEQKKAAPAKKTEVER